MTRWKPRKIIINERVREDTVTKRVIERCPGVPVRIVKFARAQDVIAASKVLSEAKGGMLDTVLAGKGVLFIMIVPTSAQAQPAEQPRGDRRRGMGVAVPDRSVARAQVAEDDGEVCGSDR
jgi:hypothetical protein